MLATFTPLGTSMTPPYVALDRLRQRVLRTVRRLRGRLPDAPNTPHAPTMATPVLEGND